MEDMMYMQPQSDTITIVVTIIGALGGLELIRFLLDRFLPRKRDKARDKADTIKDSVEIEALDNEKDRQQIAFLEDRIKERDEKVDALYAELRNEQKAHLETMKEKQRIELLSKELEIRRCDKRGCGNRIPPSDLMD